MLHSTVGGLEVYFFILQNLKKFLTSLEITKWLVLVSKIYLSLLLEYMKNVLIYRAFHIKVTMLKSYNSGPRHGSSSRFFA